MKIYFAGISSNLKRFNYLKDNGANKLMLTYADAWRYGAQLPRFKSNNFDILFDSGAYSCMNRGIEINIPKYCDYLRKNEISKYIVLDKIGDHKETMENQHIMEDLGMSPIPVYHYGSDIENLLEISDKYNYICLGGTVGRRLDEKISFFEQVFSLGLPVKFHGLGLTDLNVMKMFPFYSVDSTTWLIAEKCNKIFINGKRCKAPAGMTGEEKFKNTISYFVKNESESNF